MNRLHFHLIRLLLTSVLLLLVQTNIAQTLKGIVVDGETGKGAASITVANMTNHYNAYTDADGKFTITAKRGDQISFSGVGYKTQQKTVPTSSGIAEMRIDLFKLSYTLDEFVLQPRYTAYQLDSMERVATYARPLARMKGGSIMSPISFIAEKLSKRSKRIFKFQKDFRYWEADKFIESRYTPTLVAQLTPLRGDTLAYFMNANPMPYDYARVASELELKIWIRERYKEWLKAPVYPEGVKEH